MATGHLAATMPSSHGEDTQGEEIWRDIAGFEGLYQVSSVGSVMRKNGKLLSQWVDRKGYLVTKLSNRGLRKHFFVHRLVALSFIDNPLCLPMCNHLDGNKKNNCVSNLEWTDAFGNMRHAKEMGLLHRSNTQHHTSGYKFLENIRVMQRYRDDAEFRRRRLDINKAFYHRKKKLHGSLT